MVLRGVGCSWPCLIEQGIQTCASPPPARAGAVAPNKLYLPLWHSLHTTSIFHLATSLSHHTPG